MMDIFVKAAEYAEKDDYQQELQVLTSGFLVDPENCVLFVKLGRCYRRLGMSQKALECYEKAKSLNPDDPTIYANIGVVYMTNGQPEKGKPYFQQAIRMVEADPLSATANDKATLYGNYGRCIGLTGDLEGAREMLIKARDMGYAEKYLKAHCDDLHITLDAPAAKPQKKVPVQPQADSRQPVRTQSAAPAEQKPAQQKKSGGTFRYILRSVLLSVLVYLLYQLLTGGLK